MDTDHVTTFLEIAHSGSFRAASKRLNLSQSTVSARIGALEYRLGVSLFDRSRRKITLSEAGRRFLDPAERVAEALRDAETAVAHASALSRRLRVGAVEVIALSWLPLFVSQFSARYPNVTLDICVRATAELSALRESEALDLIFVPQTSPHLRTTAVSLGSVEWRLATTKKMFADAHFWSPDQLAKHRLAVLGMGSLIGPVFQDFFRASSVRPGKLITCDSVALLTSVIRSGAAIGVMPIGIETADDKQMTYHHLSSPLPQFQYVAETKASHDTLAKEASEIARACSTFAA